MSEVHYAAKEERLNILTHAIGVVLSLIGLIFLITKSTETAEFISSIIFGMSLILLYSASTLYHASKDHKLRSKLRIFDHAAIYVLIAGTYTPICLITLRESVGVTFLTVIWSVALTGIILKIFLTGRFNRLSTGLYVLMGWIAVFAIKPLMTAMSFVELMWLLAGGICYTLGAILYSIRSMPMNHATFHVFVLGGSFCHYMLIYLYVL